MTNGSNFMAQHGLAMLQNGFSVLPIRPGTKVPGVFYGGGGVGWVGMNAWSSFCEEPASERMVQKWCEFLVAGVGVACGNVVGIDVDVLDAELSAAVEKAITEELGETPLRRVGRAPKFLLVYRAAEPFQKWSDGVIDVLCSGSQFVAHAIHPDTGEPYAWTRQSPSDVFVQSLPVVSRDQVAAAVIEAREILPPELRTKPRKSGEGATERAIGEGGGGTSPLGLTAHPDAVLDAASALKNDELNWTDWNRRGMALFAACEGADWGYESWHFYSARAVKNDPRETDARWQSYHRSPPKFVGAGTLFDLAKEDGWVPPANLDFHAGWVDLTDIDEAIQAWGPSATSKADGDKDDAVN